MISSDFEYSCELHNDVRKALSCRKMHKLSYLFAETVI